MEKKYTTENQTSFNKKTGEAGFLSSNQILNIYEKDLEHY